MFCLMLCLMRLVIAFALLYSGIIWISATTSIGDLLLNAAALVFVLDIDEIVAGALLPEQVLQVVRNIVPLRVPTPPGKIDAVICAVLCSCVLVVTYTQSIAPNVADMLQLKKEMCDGHVNFVVHHNTKLNLVASKMTAKFNPEFNESSYLATAVSELINFNGDMSLHALQFGESGGVTPQNSLHCGSDTEKYMNFELIAHVDAAELASKNYACADWDWNIYVAAFFTSVRQTSQKDVGTTKKFRCGDFKEFCGRQESIVLRTLCPTTCGCNDALSGLLLFGAAAGCPELCKSPPWVSKREARCVDHDLSSDGPLANWTRYWEDLSMAQWMRDPRSQQFINHFKAKGCVEVVTNMEISQELTMGSLQDFAPCFETPTMTFRGDVSPFALCIKTCCTSEYRSQLGDGSCPEGCNPGMNESDH